MKDERKMFGASTVEQKVLAHERGDELAWSGLPERSGTPENSWAIRDSWKNAWVVRDAWKHSAVRSFWWKVNWVCLFCADQQKYFWKFPLAKTKSPQIMNLVFESLAPVKVKKLWLSCKGDPNLILKVSRIGNSASWYCCDRKSRASCTQSFAPWPQATIVIMLAISLRVHWSLCSIVRMLTSAELTRRNLSYCCLLALHIWWSYSSRTSRSWWIIQSTQHHRRGCNSIKVTVYKLSWLKTWGAGQVTWRIHTFTQYYLLRWNDYKRCTH